MHDKPNFNEPGRTDPPRCWRRRALAQRIDSWRRTGNAVDGDAHAPLHTSRDWFGEHTQPDNNEGSTMSTPDNFYATNDGPLHVFPRSSLLYLAAVKNAADGGEIAWPPSAEALAELRELHTLEAAELAFAFGESAVEALVGACLNALTLWCLALDAGDPDADALGERFWRTHDVLLREMGHVE